ncbi:MAG: class I tRNA ligase family protein, partial [Candidatus Didemnitutus sp.]|nr:class I tRNA ligase family protein [Candidatus Didemnitutus sp.]
DWCISRQLWWGHRIPVWYRRGLDKEQLTEADLRDPEKVHISLHGPADKSDWVQEEDVLDTWASSWLWPFATLGWPNQAAMARRGYDYFYPTNTLVTGPDIIFFWVARMIMAGLEYTRTDEPIERRVPFKDVYFTGIIRDAQGRKMSKSLGNSPDPLDLIAKYGADGLRFGIVSIAPQGQDIRFQEDRIESGKNFCNKLWNACRFRQMSGEMADNSSRAAVVARLDAAKFDDDDHAILDRLLGTTRAVDQAFASFEFNTAAQALYGFFWNDFCDWYVEVSKAKLLDAEMKDNCLAIQDLVLRQTLLMLHPFTPFITEELWRLLGYGAEGTFLMRDVRIEDSSVLATDFGVRDLRIDQAAAGAVGRLKLVTSQIRAFKADHGEAAKKDSELVVEATDAQWANLEPNLAKLHRMMGASSITRGTLAPNVPVCVTACGTWNLIRQLQVADVAGEKARLTKERETLTKHIAGTEARLSNETFVSKAPPAVLEGARKQLADLKAKHAEVERLLAGLS